MNEAGFLAILAATTADADAKEARAAMLADVRAADAQEARAVAYADAESKWANKAAMLASAFAGVEEDLNLARAAAAKSAAAWETRKAEVRQLREFERAAAAGEARRAEARAVAAAQAAEPSA